MDKNASRLRGWTAVRAGAFAIALLCLNTLPGCGGGGGGTAAPTNLSYPHPPLFTIGVAITPLTPTVSGMVTSYGVSPALPAGLTFNAGSGVISGTPTATHALTTYTVTAANSGGSATTSVSIAVNPTHPTASYGSPSYSYTVGVASVAVSPVSSGGSTTWSVQPAFPQGLTLNTENGQISGTPSQAAAAATYKVTASNAAGNVTVPLTIAVAAAPVLDLGHVQAVTFAGFGGTYLLSTDGSRWVLWNFATAAELASGTAACIPAAYDGTCNPPPISLAGSAILIGTATGLELRSAPTGQVTAEITTSYSWAALASDGSYACAGGKSGLGCWSPSGQQLFSETGNYASAKVFAAPNQLQVALGARGSNLIETITTAGWSAATGPTFTGTFYSWFTDGGSFITTNSANETVWIYSNATVQLDQRSLPALTNLTGQGNWFWTFAITNLTSTQQPLNIYKVGNSALPTATYSFYETSPTQASGLSLAVFNASALGTVNVIDLSGAAPVNTSYTLPIDGFQSFAATSASQWLVGSNYGVILDGSGLPGSSRFFNYGRVWSIAGGGTRVAVATASGRIISYNTTTNAIEQTITQQGAELAMSADGSELAVALYHYLYQDDYTSDRSINLYSLPAAALIRGFPFSYTYGVSAPVLNEISLSADGSTLGEVFTQGNTSTAAALNVQSGSSIFSTTSGTWGAPLRLSPDGTLAAFTDVAPGAGVGGQPATTVFQNGSMSTSLSGWSVAWLDDARLLANNTTVDGNNPSGYEYTGASLFGPTGTLLGNPPLPEVTSLQPLGGDLIYAQNLNEILSVTTGMPVWASADANSGLGALTTSSVVFVSGALLLAQPYTTAP